MSERDDCALSEAAQGLGHNARFTSESDNYYHICEKTTPLGQAKVLGTIDTTVRLRREIALARYKREHPTFEDRLVTTKLGVYRWRREVGTEVWCLVGKETS